MLLKHFMKHLLLGFQYAITVKKICRLKFKLNLYPQDFLQEFKTKKNLKLYLELKRFFYGGSEKRKMRKLKT